MTEYDTADDRPVDAGMSNEEVARNLRLVADLLELQGENPFKLVAYRRAAETIAYMDDDVTDVWREGRLEAVPGIGAALEKKIDEMMRTGRLELLERLQAEVPAGVLDLLRIPGVGPKKARLFWQELGITSLEQAEQAARTGELQKLQGIGARAEAQVLAGVEEILRRRKLSD